MKRWPVERLCEETASGEPLPGGGSVSALVAAFAAALAAMVARVTRNRRGPEEGEGPLSRLAAEAEALRLELLDDIQRDSDAYRAFLSALALPRRTPEQAAHREAAVQEALQGAARMPLAVAEKAARVLPLAARAAREGIPGAAADALVAAMLARSALRCSALNVRANARQIRDRAYADTLLARCLRLEEEARRQEEALLSLWPELS